MILTEFSEKLHCRSLFWLCHLHCHLLRINGCKQLFFYLRKMAIDGYIVNTDTTPLKKQYEEMHKIGININQIAKKVNTTGDLYPEEMQELKEMVKELWHILRSSPLK